MAASIGSGAAAEVQNCIPPEAEDMEFLNEDLLQEISKNAQKALKGAAPALKEGGHKAVDYSVGASEIAAKGASIAKVTMMAPSTAPFAGPSINSSVDYGGQQARAVLKNQVDNSVDVHAPKIVDASVKSTGSSVNTSHEKLCS